MTRKRRNRSAKNVTKRSKKKRPKSKYRDLAPLQLTQMEIYLLRIIEAFDLHALKNRCFMPKRRAMRALNGVKGGLPNERFAFKDNGSDILAVAHLDTVQDANTFSVVNLSDETLIYNPKLDDRLGFYTIVDLLPRLGIELDILLTENEERGDSTAQYFQTNKKYNWIVEFDRYGTTTVTYDYDWQGLLEEFFKTDHGLFSDICYMEHVGCKALNVGVGYYGEHTNRSFFVLEEYFEQIARFMLFYQCYKDVFMEHIDTGEGRKLTSKYWERDYYESTYGTARDGIECCADRDERVYHGEDDDNEYWCPHCDEIISVWSTYLVGGARRVCMECGVEVYFVKNTNEVTARNDPSDEECECG